MRKMIWADLTKCFNLDNFFLQGFPDFSFLFELFQLTLSQWHCTYTCGSNNPRGNPSFTRCKSPPNVSRLFQREYFLCRNPSEVSDSRLGCVIQSGSAEYRQQQQFMAWICTKGQKLTNGTPALAPLSRVSISDQGLAIGAALRGLLITKLKEWVCDNWLCSNI